jgi:D-hydroxyproline dehydrogenase subunit alpha
MSDGRIELFVDDVPLWVERDATVAAALLDAGVTAFRTSVAGEPRAPLCGMGICYECRVTIDGVAQQRSCMTRVAPGMRVHTTQHRLAAVPDSVAPETDRADVVIVGGGPAGIAAATRAAESGERALLIDEGLGPGGQIWRPRANGNVLHAAARWIERLHRSGAITRATTSVIDLQQSSSGILIRAESMGRAIVIEAGAVVLATGARERFLPFPGWTLPNVFGIGGAQALLESGASFRGKRIVIAGSGPLLLPVAASLAASGADVKLVAEQTSRANVIRFASGLWRTPARLAQAIAYRSAFRRTRYRTGTWVAAASGDDRLRAVMLTDGPHRWSIDCDVLCTAFGLVPNTELAILLGCELQDGVVVVDERQATSIPGVFCAGEPTGIGGVDLAVLEGELAGLAAAGRSTDAGLVRRRRGLERQAEALDRAFALRPELAALATDDTIVCRCEDVRSGAVRREWTPRQAKLYTRIGMGPCQGRICGAALECTVGWPRDTKRPPIQPVRLSTLATGNHAVSSNS